MGARTARARHKKDLARRRKLAERAGYQARQAYRREYPEVDFRPADAPDGFVRLIREGVAAVRFDDRGRFTREEARAFALFKREGFPVWPATLIRYGELVFSSIPEDRLLAYVPFCDVMFTMGRGCLVARFRSLKRHKGEGGTAYYSRHEPTLELGGRRLVVAFSGHAAVRACDRAVPTWRTYGGLGDAYALLEQCLEFEPCGLPGGQPGFTFYENCDPSPLDCGRRISRAAGMALGILGAELDPACAYAYRIGYCPAVVEGRFIKAKTLLFPGQRGTPEHELILRHERDPAERRRKLAEAELLDAARLRQTLDFGLMRWFHGFGVPQVIPRRVQYADPFTEKPWA